MQKLYQNSKFLLNNQGFIYKLCKTFGEKSQAKLF
jgi:hypothetical protein